LPFVTVTSSWTVSEDPAVKIIVRVPLPDVIVPFVIDQLYVAPAPAEGTEALLPGEFGQIDVGAEITTEGSARMTTFVVAGSDVQPFAVAVTLYTPAAESGADRICGFCSPDVNPLGPVQA